MNSASEITVHLMLDASDAKMIVDRRRRAPRFGIKVGGRPLVALSRRLEAEVRFLSSVRTRRTCQ